MPIYDVPMIMNEQNVYKTFYRKAKTIALYLRSMQGVEGRTFCISTQSSTDLRQIPSESIDFVFTDPPYGSNINYSEMNFIWESWLGRFTDIRQEAIINNVQHKGVGEYEDLVTSIFGEAYRVLKPDGYACVSFHNSSSQVWSAILSALVRSGFVVRDTQLFDRRHGTFKQFVSSDAVGYDLILHCKKLKGQTRKQQTNLDMDFGIFSFLEHTYFVDKHQYTTRYTHVKRGDEIDFRRLYSEWLAARVKAANGPGLDFAEFRRMAELLIRKGRSGV